MNYFFDDVTDWLSTGGDLDLARDLTGQDGSTTIAQLRAHGVTHVLDVRSEWEDKAEWVAGGLAPENYCHVPIVDHWNHTPSEEWFQAVEEFVLNFWFAPSPSRLYVHCHMGINRGTSAAMLALLTIDPSLSAMDAFHMIRKARPAAGLVYAEAVGARHIIRSADDWTGEFQPLEEGTETYKAVTEYLDALKAYWTPAMIQAVNRGIAYYRDAEGGTKVIA
jgi:rhodanese-related sulfurtransferase